MALSGTLQNFAGGVLHDSFQPYKIGDYIEAQGMPDRARDTVFHTIINTPDNKVISYPTADYPPARSTTGRARTTAVSTG